MRLAITATDPAGTTARRLAAELNLPWLDTTDREKAAAFDALLSVTPEGLQLRETGRHAPGPVRVDFAGRDCRRRCAEGRKQALGRAAGLKSGYNPKVIDATGGLGRDAFVLAALGCQVTVLERSPVVAALLRDGLQRAANGDESLRAAAERICLHQADACQWLAAVAEPPEVVYLDPMYPERRKSALTKKEMRLFRKLVGEDADAPALFAAALKAARRRVVVKRPQQAEYLGEKPPDFAITGKSTRFDIYLSSCHESQVGQISQVLSTDAHR